MPRSETETADLARKAAQRIERDLQRGEQLSLLPEPALPDPVQDVARGAGRPKGAQNKGSSQLRDWLASRGLKLPEEVIAEMAGLHRREGDAFAFALAQAERLLAHVGETAVNRVYRAGVGHVELEGPWQPSPSEFIETFKFFYATARQAAGDLLPYGTPKASPDVQVNQQVNVIVPAQPSTPQAIQPVRTGRMMPADVAAKVSQNQYVADAETIDAESDTRTDGASD